MTPRHALQRLCQEYGTLLHLSASNQLCVRVSEGGALLTLGDQLHKQGFYLVTLIGTDERELVDNCFKLTYLFSHPSEDLFLFVEHPLIEHPLFEHPLFEHPLPAGISGHVEYPSLYHLFPAVDPFERELADLLGLYPRAGDSLRVRPGSWLHECYPPGLYPLRRDRTQAAIRVAIENHRQHRAWDVPRPPDGQWLLPVGPIHAGVIEPGSFLFRLAGEVVEELSIRLGYTHKGLERMFQTSYTLADGWRLAEHVSGDSAFAHSLAYCLAAEALSGIDPPPQAELLRALFLELERMANHVGDCAALAHDVAHDLAAAELAALREQLLRLNEHLAGHRLLRGLNRPGGLVLPHPLDGQAALATVEGVSARFGELAGALARLPAFRDRLQWIGILTRQQALALGATGLVGRASGLRRDFRLQHPAGAYRDKAVQELAAQGLPPADDSIEAREASAGDCLARFLARMREVASSACIIAHILARPELASSETDFVKPAHLQARHNFEFGLGYVEGWRGDVVYWLMQDKLGRIYRCQVRDPSLLNWPTLKAAVEPHDLDGEYLGRHRPPGSHTDSILPDFPVINKSFNLSYSGNDL